MNKIEKIFYASLFGLTIFLLSKHFNDTNYTSEYPVDEVIQRTEQAFIEAEKDILSKVVPNPDIPIGPDPDVNKCACKGTGRIVHGDGHASPCPYHGVGEIFKEEASSSCKNCDIKQSTTDNVIRYRRGIFGRRYRVR